MSEALNTYNPPAEEDPAHVAAMLAKADQGLTATTPSKTEEQSQQLAGFKSVAELEKAYAELRAKMSREGAPKPADNQPAPADPNASADPAPKADDKPAEGTPAEAADAVKQAGLDLNAVEAEFAENGGKLTDETYEALAKAGFDKARVDSYIAGQQALAEQFQSRVANHVGGQEQLDAMLDWAKTGLTAEEAAAFNKTVDGADEAGVKLALEGLKAKFTAANGKEPNLVNGDGPAKADVFRSNAELTAAMRDPRYAKDPAYRRDVEQKVARSSIF